MLGAMTSYNAMLQEQQNQIRTAVAELTNGYGSSGLPGKLRIILHFFSQNVIFYSKNLIE